MTSQSMSRKRPAPGTSPGSYPQQIQQPANMYGNAVGPQLSDDQFLQWGQSAQAPNTYNESSAYGVNNFPLNNAPPSNQLTRRPMSQVVTRPRLDAPANQPWIETAGEISPVADGAWGDDLNDLKQKAQVAKRDAQSKRKQIPPFVQKLNSFLEDGKNTDLIRWSDEGNSFIVLDEDEFAKTLIPELFKHNNYASFVRQLNMYGFHKKVGLSDNSMRASERKNKSPSEYSNPYFRRGHPDLLWLIQKPKNVAAPGKKGRTKQENDAVEDDADDYVEEALPAVEGHVRPRHQLTLGHGENTLSQEQFQSVQRELAAIRHQQSQISRMMSALKREHEQLYGQAATFQDQHTRHENSINAILTFLATVYNRSLQGHEGAQGIANLFSGAIPHESSQGNVVDVGDYNFDNLPGSENVLGKPYKKAPLLLTDGGQGRASTMSPSSTNSPYPPRQTRRTSQQFRGSQTPQPHVEEVFDSNASTPMPQNQNITNDQRQRDIMSVIQNTNARHSQPNTPIQDFSNVLSSLENAGGNTPLTNSQRADVLRLINNSTKQPGDNALINSTPPPGPSNFDRRLASTQADLDSLAKLQAEQDKSVQNLANLLQPLSPTGSIPGIGDGQNLPPPPLDIDDFLSHNEYFADFPSDGNGNYDFTGAVGNSNGNQSGINFADYNDDEELFGSLPPTTQQNGAEVTPFAQFDGSEGGEDGGGRIESVASSEVTTPTNASSISGGVDGGPTTRSKGRKLSVGAEAEGGKSPAKRSRRS